MALTLEQFEGLAGDWVRWIARFPRKDCYTHPSYMRIVKEGGHETIGHILYWIQRGKGGYWSNALHLLSRRSPPAVNTGTEDANKKWVSILVDR